MSRYHFSRTVESAIGIVLSSVSVCLSVFRLSVCLSVRSDVCLSETLCIVALRVGVEVKSCTGYRRVPRKAFPIHFFRHFRCRVYPLATIAVGCIASGVAIGSVVTWQWLFQTRHFWRFGSAAIPFAVFSTIGLLCDILAEIDSILLGMSVLWDSVSSYQHTVWIVDKKYFRLWPI